MYVYIKTEKTLWTVGHYEDDKFIPESDHDSAEAAAARVRYLNGGTDDTAQLRDQFAGQALAGMLGSYGNVTEMDCPERAKYAYLNADAMLAARKKK